MKLRNIIKAAASNKTLSSAIEVVKDKSNKASARGRQEILKHLEAYRKEAISEEVGEFMEKFGLQVTRRQTYLEDQIEGLKVELTILRTQVPKKAKPIVKTRRPRKPKEEVVLNL